MAKSIMWKLDYIVIFFLFLGYLSVFSVDVKAEGKDDLTAHKVNDLGFDVPISEDDIIIMNPIYIDKVYSTKTFELITEANSATYQSSNEKVAKINAKGIVTLVGAGKTNITVIGNVTVRTDSNGLKTQKCKFTYILTVKLGKQKISTRINKYNKPYSSKPFNLETKVLGKAKVTYKSSNPKVAKINSKGIVMLTGIGKAEITIKTSKTSQYQSKTKRIQLNVSAPKIKLYCANVAGKSNTIALQLEGETKAYDGFYSEVALDSGFKRIIGKGYKKNSKYMNEFIHCLKIRNKNRNIIGIKLFVRTRPYIVVNGKKKFYDWSNTDSIVLK